MFYMYFVTSVIIVYMFCDFNYLIRTFFTIWSGRLCEKQYSWNDVTTIYGLCTLQDCDVWFRNVRLARLLRELDFARYHFYDRTGIYHRSQKHGIKSLQGSTLTICLEPIPLFSFYKILTKLVYWEERTLYLEHEVVTLHDNKVRCVFVSLQFGLNNDKEPTVALLLEGLLDSNTKPNCPEYITAWLNSSKVLCEKLQK